MTTERRKKRCLDDEGAGLQRRSVAGHRGVKQDGRAEATEC